MSEISPANSEKEARVADLSLPLDIKGPDQVRALMQRTIAALLETVPGPSVKLKVARLARELGFTPRRLDDLRYGEVARPPADEFLALQSLVQRSQSFDARAGALRDSIKEARHARAQDHRVNSGCGCEPNVAGGGLAARIGETDLADAAGLGRFAGTVIDCRALTLDEAAPSHRRLAALARDLDGEFTEGAEAEMHSMGLDRTAWLYRPEPALPVLFIGADIPIVSDAERARLIGRPVADQLLPPTFLRLIMDHLTDLLTGAPDPTVYRITARLHGQVYRFDRLGFNWVRSGLAMSSCVLGAA